MKKDKKDEKLLNYKYEKGEKTLLEKRKKRLTKMAKKKRKLGINDKCDRMDALFTPHLTSMEDPNQDKIQTSADFLNDAVLMERSRKSKPLAFEKVTSAVALLIKENPKCSITAFSEKYREKNGLIQNVYYENFSQQQKKEVLKKYTYHLGKYGIAYWREYIKQTYRMQHEASFDKDGNPSLKTKWVYDVFDVVAERIHPKYVLLDDQCHGVKDVNKPARDCAVLNPLSQEQFEALYPVEKYPKAAYVKQNQQWLIEEYLDDLEKPDDGQKKIMVVEYENVYENLKEVWANNIPISSVPLPGDQLSLCGEKWVEDEENYDGIGIGQIIELYQPIIDDILNCSLENLRLRVRPNEDWFNGASQDDESEDVTYGSGVVRKFSGSPTDVKYSQPPAITDADIKERTSLSEEIDSVSMIPSSLAGAATKAKTAYQEALQKENAMVKLSLPLSALKKTLEDAANLDLSLYKIAYSVPLETKVLSQADDEFDEGLAIYQQAEAGGYEDERVEVMKKDDEGNPTSIARRQFKIMELPIGVESGNTETTGRLVDTDEKNFWELTPEHFNWKGRIEIIGESFLPVSKAMDDQSDKETIEYLMNIPVKDAMGNPTLTDKNGQPFTIDKVALVKERAKLNRKFDPDRFIIPMDQGNINQGAMQNNNPLESQSDLSSGNLAGTQRPETGNLKAK